ncbi:MAG: hypothetical protein CM1200mP3_07890 [Chloroflexota bacterium]|nr:MAG: hypothetical protein CM1200mP3_07890 [Chloroflexota bacterium]
MATKKPFKKPQLEQIELVKREDQTEDLSLMWLTKPEGYTFKPGQYCTIGHEGVERAYSIASAPHEELLELFIELVPLHEGGVLTPCFGIWRSAAKLPSDQEQRVYSLSNLRN